jgi:hypothetical protein
MTPSGFFTFIHHSGPIIEWSDNINKRIDVIRRGKPEHEQATRLRHLVRVPEDRLPALYAAKAEYERIRRQASVKHTRIVLAAQDTYHCIWYSILDDPATLALVRELVPDCQWDGETIFPRDACKEAP